VIRVVTTRADGTPLLCKFCRTPIAFDKIALLFTHREIDHAEAVRRLDELIAERERAS